MLHLNNDSKIQMKLNIQQHRQKLLQCLENSNDTVVKPKIKSVSNNLEKFNLNHNVKQKIASITELISSNVQKKQSKPVVTNKEKNLEVLTDVYTKKYKSRSSVTLNQLQPNIKVNIQDELPVSNVELKPSPILTIEKKDPEPIIKTLKEQLIEELYNSSSSEDIDDYVSVGSNEFSDTNSKSNVHANDSSNLIPVGVDKYYEQEQPDKEKSKKDSAYYSCDSDNAQFDINNTATRKKSCTKKMAILTNSQHKSNKPEKKGRKPLDRLMHKAKEQEIRVRMAQHFDNLGKACSYLNTKRLIPSKRSILLSAKKECDLLKHFEIKLIEEKQFWYKSNHVLKKKIAKLIEMKQ